MTSRNDAVRPAKDPPLLPPPVPFPTTSLPSNIAAGYELAKPATSIFRLPYTLPSCRLVMAYAYEAKSPREVTRRIPLVRIFIAPDEPYYHVNHHTRFSHRSTLVPASITSPVHQSLVYIPPHHPNPYNFEAPCRNNHPPAQPSRNLVTPGPTQDDQLFCFLPHGQVRPSFNSSRHTSAHNNDLENRCDNPSPRTVQRDNIKTPATTQPSFKPKTARKKPSNSRQPILRSSSHSQIQSRLRSMHAPQSPHAVSSRLVPPLFPPSD